MFLPRSLYSLRTPHSNTRPPPPPPTAVREPAADVRPTEDPAILCALAFSDYEIWSNPSLRDPNHDGFVPLRMLMHTSSVFLAANVVSLTEATIVKSLRAHATDTFDIQMIVADKSRTRCGRYGYAGGYEVRRKDWAEVTRRFPTFSPEYWDTRTIYIENIPIQFRSMVGISKLLHRLLLTGERSPSFSMGDYRCVQSIVFPPHHQDPPDVLPKCKGFALVTLSEPSATSPLLTNFPYHNRANNHKHTADDDASEEEREARKAGFRTLLKERWEELQAEYVEYRNVLLGCVAEPSSSSASHSIAPPTSTPTALANKVTGPSREARLQHTSEVPRKFPPGCVIFARHIPQDTNKTALRTLFSALLAGDSAAALDYVDYTKGLDTCYLRLTTQEHALSLLKRFKLKRGQGDQEEDMIVLELLDGRREEMYWADVPDKVRALAVQRAQQVHKAQPDDNDDQRDESMGPGERKPSKKRQRHGSVTQASPSTYSTVRIAYSKPKTRSD